MLIHGLTNANQHGFLQRKLQCNQRTVFLNALTNAVNKWKSLIAIYLDMAKAFHRVVPPVALAETEICDTVNKMIAQVSL